MMELIRMKPQIYESILKELKNIYHEAEKIFDIEIRTECLLTFYKYLNNVSNNEEDNVFWEERFDIILACIMKKMEDGDSESALQLLGFITADVQQLPMMQYYKGIMLYQNKNYIEACQVFEQIADYFGDRENYHFFRGNCYYLSHKYTEAEICYRLALQIRKSFTEAENNIAVLHGDLPVDRLETYPWISSLCNSSKGYKSWPIFINSRDRVNCLKDLVEWLDSRGYSNIIILDNDSTYPELLSYYETLDNKVNVSVIYLKQNMGHKAIWSSRILEKMDIRTPYVYTDSDVIPDKKCPENIVEILFYVLKKYHYLYKVGLSIKISDSYVSEDVKKEQARFSIIPIEKDIYMAAVDTTFALYRNYRSYSIFNTESMRVKIEDGELIHRPWYYDENNLPADELYYIEHANSSSTFATAFKNANIK